MNKPKASEYHTDDGMHAAMRDYAEHMSAKGGALRVDAYFPDGSGGTFDFIEQAVEPIPYKTRDGEEWTEYRRTSKFVSPLYFDTPLTRKDMETAVTKWLNSDEPVPTSIVFTLEGLTPSPTPIQKDI